MHSSEMEIKCTYKAIAQQHIVINLPTTHPIQPIHPLLGQVGWLASFVGVKAYHD